MNMNDALALHEYALDAARALLSESFDDIASDDTPDADIARHISADALESAAHTDNPLFANIAPFNMILTYELICAIITNLADCAYSDIAAES